MIARASLQGAELEAAYDWGRGFITVAGAIIDGENETTGDPLNSVYPNRLSATLGFRLLDDKLTLGTRLTVVDDDPTVGSEVSMGDAAAVEGNGGNRVLLGHWPRTEPKVFQLKGSVLSYDKPPPGAELPDYQPISGPMAR